MLSILILIFILFMCIILPLNFLLPPIVGAINTGGSIMFIIVAVFMIAIAVTIAIVAYKRITKEPEPTMEEEKKGFAWIDEAKKAQLASSMGGEGAKVTMEITEEIVTENSKLTELEKSALENKNLTEGRINWTVTTSDNKSNNKAGYNAALTEKDKAVVKAKKINNKVKTVFKILGIIALVCIEAFLMIGAVRKVTVFGDIKINDISINSISKVAGYYIDTSSSHQSYSYGDEESIYISYTYLTNKKTATLAQKYKEYLAEHFTYQEYYKMYYITDPNNSNYMYTVEVSGGGTELFISYSYEEKPYYIL